MVHSTFSMATGQIRVGLELERACWSYMVGSQLIGQSLPAKTIFGEPQEARTRQFLDRVIQAGRMGGGSASG